MVTTIEELLRRLALQDEVVVCEALAMRPGAGTAPALPQRVQGIARLSALVAIDAPVVSYQAAVVDALAAGVTADEIVATLIVVAPLVGAARVTSAAPAIATALGYDLDDAFERMDGCASGTS
jgi:4-carboxymuconolactone decarboxylase